jgi:hypothetical protein
LAWLVQLEQTPLLVRPEVPTVVVVVDQSTVEHRALDLVVQVLPVSS